MRLVYVHKSLRSARDNIRNEGQYVWDPKQEATNKLLTEDFATDGYVKFFEGLLSRGIVDEIVVVIESRGGPGRLDIGNLECYVVPQLKLLYDILKPDDVIWMRGGYKWWIPIANEIKAREHWLLFYSAGTWRSAWEQWDIVLWDYIAQPLSRRGKLYLPFVKPINEVFRPLEMDRIYDVCIGASKIYDVKSQFRFVEALNEHAPHLKCIMPGGGVRSTHTSNMFRNIRSLDLNLEVPGYVPRKRLTEILNQSKVFLHQCSGQNDRASLEAMACGVPLFTLRDSGKCYPPWITKNKETCRIASNPGDPKQLAEDIQSWLAQHSEVQRKAVSYYFNRHNNIEITYGWFEKLFEAIRKVGKPDRVKLVKELM